MPSFLRCRLSKPMKAEGLQPEAQLEEARQQHPQPGPPALAERDDHDVGRAELAELLLAAQPALQPPLALGRQEEREEQDHLAADPLPECSRASPAPDTARDQRGFIATDARSRQRDGRSGVARSYLGVPAKPFKRAGRECGPRPAASSSCRGRGRAAERLPSGTARPRSISTVLDLAEVARIAGDAQAWSSAPAGRAGRRCRCGRAARGPDRRGRARPAAGRSPAAGPGSRPRPSSRRCRR